MDNLLGFLMATLTMTSIMLAPFSADAGVRVYDKNGANLGVVDSVQCGANITCAKAPSNKVSFAVDTALTLTRYPSFFEAALTAGTSTTPSATTLYLAQVKILAPTTLTGIAINNAATVGTNKYIVALYNAAGTKLANSAIAGVLTAGASVWQEIPFTATLGVVGPGVYWIGLFVDGTTDRFYSIPAVGAMSGLAGSVTGQTFGTVGASITPPTTFTADKGPVAYTY